MNYSRGILDCIMTTSCRCPCQDRSNNNLKFELTHLQPHRSAKETEDLCILLILNGWISKIERPAKSTRVIPGFLSDTETIFEE